MSVRQEYRQHTKSTLLAATEILFRERETLLLVERRKWMRRLKLAASGAFVVGTVIGGTVARLL